MLPVARVISRNFIHRKNSAKRSLSTVPGTVSGLNARVCAVLGGQWGDEGKGKLADVLAKNYDVVCRFNGGANAGHTVIADGKKFAFHLLPCGLIYPHTMNILGNGTVVHLPQLFEETEPLDEAGIDWRGRLLISNRAHMLFDYHQIIDGINEERLSGADGNGMTIGTTRKGIGPAYTAKMSRNGLRFGDLAGDWGAFETKYRKAVETHQLSFDFEYDIQGELDKYAEFKSITEGMIVDGVHYVNEAYRSGKKLISEGANAAMLDVDFGTYPFVTSSTTTSGGIATGLGLSPNKIDCVVGVVKAYTTRVGWGPFPTELTDDLSGGMIERGAPGTDIGKHIQDVGAEYGVTTGRKRRCGWLDLPVINYANMLNGYTSINITKLDVLDQLDEVRICTAYRINGQTLVKGSMPSTIHEMDQVEPVYETLPGWKQDISKCRTYDQLPENAKKYLERIEELTDIPISWVGTGPGREEMVSKGF